MSATEIATTPHAHLQESEAVAEARRQMEVCNACRYCESYCAVFPAMTLRRSFATTDLAHLANLCHGCKGCYHACQYAPPHPFAINIPATFARVRQESYTAFAWPTGMGRIFARSGTLVSLLAAFLAALVMVLAVAIVDPTVLWGAHTGPGAFYRVMPWWLMTLLAVLCFGFAVVALAMGGVRYWRGTDSSAPIALGPATEAAVDILTLRNLGGGGHGCNDFDDRFTMARRWLHHAMFYGFFLCFAATSVATIYHHVLDDPAPYAFWSLPVQLGTWGGMLLCIGTAGLAWVKIVTDPVPVARELIGGEFAVLALLFLVAATGLLLLVLRATGAMGIVLALHLGLVLALFLALPYSKMVHGVYRGLALLRNSVERRRA